MPAVPDPAMGPLAFLFPPDVVTMATDADGDPSSLSAAEAHHMARALPKRVREFAAGRLCARRAMERFDLFDMELLAGPDRAPLWPPGIVGSISHTTGYCAAAVGDRRRFRSIGLDIETADRVTPDLYGQFLTEAERAQLAPLPPDQADGRATLIFSAKEAFYKSQYPVTLEWLDFADIEVGISDGDALTIAPCRPLQVESLFPSPWRGKFIRFGRFVATGFAFSQAGSGQALR
jgi:4'-phosphopantetheinyl transferase EntD